MAYYLVIAPLQLDPSNMNWVEIINRHHPVGTVLELSNPDIISMHKLDDFYIDKKWTSQEFGWLTILS